MSIQNGAILQYFQWYHPYGGVLWDELAANAAVLVAAGFTAVWVPPAYKGAGGAGDVGYGVYDLFDLGEFHQKNSVATKYGTRAQFLAAVGAAQGAGLQVYADVVFNHKDGGDSTEYVEAQEVEWGDRNRTVGSPYTIQAWSGFHFPGRGGAYSNYQWHWYHFDAVSYDHNHPERDSAKLFRLKNKHFSTEVSHEHGNSDYLMACDIDTAVADGELRYWARWFVDATGVDGFRIDAVKHIRSSFFRDWLNHLRVHFGGRELFSVGEYWSGDVDHLHRYLTDTAGVMSLFDVPLHYRFRDASVSGSGYDLRTIFDRTLVREQPARAVTFVDNHDSQPCQSLESWVEPWFKPLAYALILLRRDGYPCVFYGDYVPQPRYFDKGREVTLYSHRFLIDRFLWARRAYGFGDQHDYFDHPNTIGWVRLGDAAHPGAMAVVLTNGSAGNKWMNTFRPIATFRDHTGHVPATVTTDANGWGNFTCRGGSVSVWLQQ
ncbi:MAG TPA: alpha-amylase [Tepidisphaeraceae bacterium]|nr:alpha-amylase [Tepidisphaeraceae bacterium]